LKQHARVHSSRYACAWLTNVFPPRPRRKTTKPARTHNLMSRLGGGIKMKKFLAAVAMSITVLSASAATAPPKVVFIGDNYTVNWTSGFAANSNWINKGTVNGPYPQNVTSSSLAENFQQDVVALHPAAVHILMGLGDVWIAGDSTYTDTPNNFLAGLQSMVKQAKAANIQVILGIEPLCGFESGGLAFNSNAQRLVNEIVGAYGAQNNLPVINYGDALCHTVGATSGSNDAIATPGGVSTAAIVYGSSQSGPQTLSLLQQSSPGELPTAAGYSLMTEMAKNTINTLNAKLTGGYLQNSQFPFDLEDNTQIANVNVNTVPPGAVMQFIPYGIYNNGLTLRMLNTTYTGANGTWASSNPVVMTVSQQGEALALTTGTAIITYTPPSGVRFSEWIMYVGAGN
jgi:hypothetical protein